jgi:hypothetical protein
MEVTPRIGLVARTALKVMREVESTAQFWSRELCQRMDQDVIKCTENGLDAPLQTLISDKLHSGPRWTHCYKD